MFILLLVCVYVFYFYICHILYSTLFGTLYGTLCYITYSILHTLMHTLIHSYIRIYTRIPFQQALTLVGRREVYLEAGQAWVPEAKLVAIICTKVRDMHRVYVICMYLSIHTILKSIYIFFVIHYECYVLNTIYILLICTLHYTPFTPITLVPRGPCP